MLQWFLSWPKDLGTTGIMGYVHLGPDDGTERAHCIFLLSGPFRYSLSLSSLLLAAVDRHQPSYRRSRGRGPKARLLTT